MIELVRIITPSKLYSYRATQHEEHALQLESLFEKTTYLMWHPLIARSFSYAPPHQQARFRPPYGKNVFYGSVFEETALYESAFHLMKERRHLKTKTETGSRTLFFVDANAEAFTHIKNYPHYTQIMDKHDYTASHQFMMANPHATFIIYPSCRDPEKRDNAAVLDINHLAKNPRWEASIEFFYDNEKRQMHWLDYYLNISWTEVS